MDCQDMVRLRWEGNGSTCYDGKTQDVAVRFLVPEVGNKTTTVQVGNTVRVRWGRQSRVWKAVVVGKEGDVATPERDVEKEGETRLQVNNYYPAF